MRLTMLCFGARSSAPVAPTTSARPCRANDAGGQGVFAVTEFIVEGQSKPGGMWHKLYGPYETEERAREVAKQHSKNKDFVAERVCKVVHEVCAVYVDGVSSS